MRAIWDGVIVFFAVENNGSACGAILGNRDADLVHHTFLRRCVFLNIFYLESIPFCAEKRDRPINAYPDNQIIRIFGPKCLSDTLILLLNLCLSRAITNNGSRRCRLP